MRPEISIAVCLALAGCGPAPTPDSLRQLEALARADDSKVAAEAASTAWGESQRYLGLAAEALDSGDAAGADRLAELGLIQGKLAMTSLREQRARGQLEIAAAVEAQRALEIERLSSAIEALELLLARERIRRHVEAVVDASRRRAAAEEERAAAGRADPEHADALLEVGREMLGRCRIEAAVLGALASAGVALEEQKASADGALALAEEALERRDLAAVQERVEDVGAGAHRAFAWAFEGTGAAAAARISELLERLAAAGFTAVPDDFGAAVSLSRGGKKGKTACGGAQRLVEIETALGDAAAHVVLEIDPRGAHPFPALDGDKGKCPAALVVPLPSAR